MEYATARQVHFTRKIMERYIQFERTYDLPSFARRFLTVNGGTYVVDVAKLKQVEKTAMSRLLEDLKGVTPTGRG